MVVAVPKDYRSKPGEYGETKKQKQFLMTPTASDMLDSLVAEYSTTRSDFLERVIRGLTAWDKEDRDRLMLQVGVIEEEIKS
jgi:hypothetical protein